MRIGQVAWFVSLAACTGASDGGPDRVPAGDWGGEHVSLQVTAAGGKLEFDCAHARISESLRLVDGRFGVKGVYVSEIGGPTKEGEPEDERPARFTGTLQGDRLTFSVELTDDNQSIGSFAAVRDAPPLLFKCQ